MSIVPKPYQLDTVSRVVRQDIDQRRSTERSLVIEDWKNISLNVGFGRYDANQWGGPDYTKDRNGIVRFRGLISVSVAITDSKIIGSIPKAYAPHFNHLTMIPTSWGIEQLRVGGRVNNTSGLPTGAFYMGGGTGVAVVGTRATGWASLNNVTWIAGDS